LRDSKTPAALEADPAFRPFNRKYLGSKRALRRWICAAIRDAAGTPEVFLDGFCGTGSIALEMAGSGARRVVAVDILESNCVILRGFAAAARGFPELSRVREVLRGLNDVPPQSGYITEAFAGSYFTRENCMRMDAIRERIAVLRSSLTREAHDYLLASFLLAADRVANTLGQYDAFLKNIHGPAKRGGRHLVDERVRTPFRLRSLEGPPAGELEVVTADLLSCVGSFPVDVAYFDPPYNGRQYCDNYHVLENLARWDKPALSGKTRKFDRGALRSPFSRRQEAAPALEALIAGTRAPHLFVSYSSEGILERFRIHDILSRFGAVSCSEVPYPVFGNGAGVSRRRSVTELLFHLRRDGEPGGPRGAGARDG
jgi:adenine-specific DNA-methyltransferase